MKLKKGDLALEFSLPDQDGKTHSINDYRGKWVLLYFYPKDFTPGCTKEACSIRDSWKNAKKYSLSVLGISFDTSASHKKFAEKYELPFALLSDPEKVVLKKYGVWGKKSFLGKTFMGTLRTSFLINPEGKISKVYEKVKPDTHIVQVLADLKSLK